MLLRIVILSALAVALPGCSLFDSAYRYDVWGIDISRHQQRIDWDKMCEKDKPHFVFLKASEGNSYADRTYRRNTAELDKRGIPWGAYHYFSHHIGGREQAANFIKSASLKKGNLHPVLDIEDPHKIKDRAKTVREAKAFCAQIKKKYGVNPIIYCSTKFYEDFLMRDFSPEDYMFWIADYSIEPSHLDWHFWQHTETHRLPGIKGRVDRNVFSGNKAELQKLILR